MGWPASQPGGQWFDQGRSLGALDCRRLSHRRPCEGAARKDSDLVAGHFTGLPFEEGVLRPGGLVVFPDVGSK